MTTSLQATLTDTFSLRRAWVATAPEFPTDVLPIVLGNLTGGSGGVSYCPCINTAAYTYLISDYPIVTSGHGNSPTFYVDRVATAPASWNPSDTLAGRSVATVTFSSSQAGKRVGYRGMGAPDGAGALISNPVAAANLLLTAIFGVSASDIEQTALATAQARAATLAYSCAGVLDLDRTPDATLTELLGCFAGCYWINADGRLVLFVDDGRVAGIQGLAMHLAERWFESASGLADRSEIVNQVAVNYAPNHYDITLQQTYQAYDDGSATLDANSQSLHGSLGPGSTSLARQHPWCRDLASVRAMQGVVITRMAYPRLKVTAYVEHLLAEHVEPGDFVGWSWPRLYDSQGRALKNQVGMVERVDTDCDQGVTMLTIRDTGIWVARGWPLDGSWSLDGTKLLGAERDLRDYA